MSEDRLNYLRSYLGTENVFHVASYVYKKDNIMYYVVTPDEYGRNDLPDGSSIDFRDEHFIILSKDINCVDADSIQENTTSVEIANYFEVYTGSRLEQFINGKLNDTYKERDAVADVLDYINSNISERIFALCGLRGTGKTTVMYQVIKKLSDYENTVYLTMLRPGLDCNKLIYELKQYESKRFIFIDEITMLTDFVEDSAYLSDILCNLKTRVIISGTDSLVFPIVEFEALYHRIIRCNLTYISYIEANRLVPQTFEYYFENGGMFESSKVTTMNDVNKYVGTTILNNIVNTFQRNKTNKWGDLRGLSEIELRTVIFKLMYAVIFSRFDKNVVGSIDLTRYINQYKYELQFEYIQSIVLNNFGLQRGYKTSENVLKDVLEVLIEIGVLIRIDNYDKPSDEKYYFTNPAIAMQLSDSILKNLKDIPGTSPNGIINRNSIKGLVFESIVVAYFSKLRYNIAYNTYFYRHENSDEIDVVLEKDGFDGKQLILCEVKFTDISDVAVLKTKWLMNSNIAKNEPDCKICNRFIVYRGETGVFSGFTSEDLIDTKTESVSEIEQRNMGIQFVNVLDLFNNIEEYINFD